MKIIKLLAAVLVTALALPVFAQTATTATTATGQTHRNQEARINQGVQSGALTTGEARNLQQQRQIQADKRTAKAEGVVTRAERRHIKREQQRASRSIHRTKHSHRAA